MNGKFLVVSSITYALKAKAELAANNIPCTLEKLDNIKDNGCGHGIRISSKDYQRAGRVLKNANIGIIDSFSVRGTP